MASLNLIALVLMALPTLGSAQLVKTFSTVDYGNKLIPGPRAKTFDDVLLPTRYKKDPDDKAHYFVIFAARGSTQTTTSVTGHAFVMWGIEDPRAKRSSYQGFGLYPANRSVGTALRSVFAETPATLDDEAANHSWPATTDRLIVEVDKYQYDETKQIAAHTKANPGGFKLMSRNCVKFVAEVSKNLGLITPEPSLLNGTASPRGFVRALIRGVDKTTTMKIGNVVYKGTVVDNQPQGKGRFSLPTAKGDARTYTGDVNYGFPHGRGSLVTKGLTYSGEFAHGLPAGRGHATFANGASLVGQFAAGSIVDGTYTAPDKDKYTGTFLNDVPSGPGTWTFRDGSAFTGSFKNGVAEGHGEITTRDGKHITGQWRGGVAVGGGTMVDRDGHSHDGTFQDGNFRSAGGNVSTHDGDLVGHVREIDKNGKTISERSIDGMSIEGRQH